ncbi:MAG TPA: response regulator [Geobacteraceae bacterium]
MCHPIVQESSVEQVLNILAIEDNQSDHLLTERRLAKAGMEVRCHRVATADELLAALDTGNWDIVLSDYSVPQMDFLESFNLIQSRMPDVPVILVSGSIGEEQAVELLKLGVWDFVFKESPARLVPAIRRSLQEASERRNRRRAEEALQESEVGYRLLFDNMLEGFASCRMIFDPAGRPLDFVYLNVNKKFGELTGLTDVVGKRVSEVIPGIRESNPELLEIYGRVAVTGVPERLETFVPPLGIWFSVSVYSTKRGEFAAVFDNITPRKRAEETLQEVTQRLRLATASARLGIWDRDCRTDRLIWDDRMYELYGVARDTPAIGFETWRSRLHPDDRDMATEAAHAAIRGDKEYDIEFRVCHPDGTIRHIKANGSVIRDENGTAIRMIGLNQDITDQKRLEEQLRHSQKMEAIGQLAGGVAHDFNNILTVIYGYCSLLQLQMGNESPYRPDIDHIFAATERAANLTKSLLAFSRKQVMSPRPLDLNDVIANVGKLLTRIIGEDVHLKTNLTPGPLSIFADSGQIEQVLMNLGTNARDAMPDGGLLTVETDVHEIDQDFIRVHGYGTPGSYAVLSVSDTGEGMDAETGKKIFEPFFTTKEVGKGTGLGLSMAYGIVKQHNGYINVYSEPGKGTTFRIYFPLMPPGPAEEKEAPPDYPGMGTETVLVAEDDAPIRQIAEMILSEFGYRVILAENGQDAINKFAANREKIDIIIMDMIMPGKNGRDAYEEIRRIRPDVRVLFMSGYSPDLLRDKGLFGRGAEIVMKPLHPLDLIRKVRSMLDA